jgi:signal transduction histidine kinase
MKTLRFDQLIDEVVFLGKKMAKDKHVKITVQYNPKINFVGDRVKLKEMMLNLVSNAIKYNRINGKVWISSEVHEGNLVINVVDTGIGIDKKDIAFIFDRFFRAKEIELYKKRTGSGIGLAVSRWIIKAHGGEIEVKSRVGVGTRFTISLPISLN